MAFDVQAAMRAAGINPADIPQEQMKIVADDLRRRARNDPAFVQAMLKERANPTQAAPPPQPEPQAAEPQQPAPQPRAPARMGRAMSIPAQQAQTLQGMAGDVMSALEKENYSRVAQGRERRRMLHEKEKESARMQHEKDMLLLRLRAMRGK